VVERDAGDADGLERLGGLFEHIRGACAAVTYPEGLGRAAQGDSHVQDRKREPVGRPDAEV
jgi:hypothetical protein